MKDKELLLISGGSNISGTLINSIAKMIGTFLDLGRAIGSSLRRIIYKQKC